MTDRLYYLDPYLRAFDATIERVEARGPLLAVTLDRTAFYPSSGGQAPKRFGEALTSVYWNAYGLDAPSTSCEPEH